VGVKGCWQGAHSPRIYNSCTDGPKAALEPSGKQNPLPLSLRWKLLAAAGSTPLVLAAGLTPPAHLV